MHCVHVHVVQLYYELGPLWPSGRQFVDLYHLALSESVRPTLIYSVYMYYRYKFQETKKTRKYMYLSYFNIPIHRSGIPLVTPATISHHASFVYMTVLVCVVFYSFLYNQPDYGACTYPNRCRSHFILEQLLRVLTTGQTVYIVMQRNELAQGRPFICINFKCQTKILVLRFCPQI